MLERLTSAFSTLKTTSAKAKRVKTPKKRSECASSTTNCLPNVQSSRLSNQLNQASRILRASTNLLTPLSWDKSSTRWLRLIVTLTLIELNSTTSLWKISSDRTKRKGRVKFSWKQSSAAEAWAEPLRSSLVKMGCHWRLNRLWLRGKMLILPRWSGPKSTQWNLSVKMCVQVKCWRWPVIDTQPKMNVKVQFNLFMATEITRVNTPISHKNLHNKAMMSSVSTREVSATLMDFAAKLKTPRLV